MILFIAVAVFLAWVSWPLFWLLLGWGCLWLTTNYREDVDDES